MTTRRRRRLCCASRTMTCAHARVRASVCAGGTRRPERCAGWVDEGKTRCGQSYGPMWWFTGVLSCAVGGMQIPRRGPERSHERIDTRIRKRTHNKAHMQRQRHPAPHGTAATAYAICVFFFAHVLRFDICFSGAGTRPGTHIHNITYHK